MNKKLLVILAGTALLAAGCNKAVNQPSASSPSNEVVANSTPSNQAMDKDKMMHEDKAMSGDHMDKDKMMEKDAMMKKEHGSYVDYSGTAIAEATKNNGKAVLFFYANWCPICRAADEAFKANLSAIPAGVTVIKTDYDSNKDLKAKYGVTIQHTFVQIDAQGQLITRWVSGDIEMLAKQIK